MKGEYTIMIIWSYFVVIAIVYSIIYLGTSKFSGTFEFHMLSWSFDYLDPEWRVLCDFFQPLLIYLLCYFFIRQLLRKVRPIFYIISGIIFGGYLSRLGFILNIALMILNFFFVKFCKKNVNFLKIHWIVHLIIMYIIYLLNGLNAIWGKAGRQFNAGAPVPWEHIYVWNLLRMTSYNVEAVNVDPLEYFAYLLYSPLYYSGPLISFADWEDQIGVIQTVQKKHKYILIGILLLILQIMAQSYALSNQKENEWIWQRQLSFFAGFSFLITSMFQIYVRYAFIWALQECWASYDNIEVKCNNQNHMFCINSATSFIESFCSSYKEFMMKYVQNVFSSNIYINLVLIYSITIILTNCDQKTIWFFVTLLIFHIFEISIKVQTKIVLILIRTIQQCIILMEIMILYTTDLDIFWTYFKHKSLYWIPIFIGTSLITQIYSFYPNLFS